MWVIHADGKNDQKLWGRTFLTPTPCAGYIYAVLIHEISDLGHIFHFITGALVYNIPYIFLGVMDNFPFSAYRIYIIYTNTSILFAGNVFLYEVIE